MKKNNEKITLRSFHITPQFSFLHASLFDWRAFCLIALLHIPYCILNYGMN